MRGPLPTVEVVAPGVWSLPVPIPGSPLGHVFVYALVGDEGVVLVDAGWDHPESRQALTEGLASAGAAVGDVMGIVVTHVHADHYGLAGWIRDASDAWVGLHPADAALVHDRYVEPSRLLARGDVWLREAGVPGTEIPAMRDASLAVLEHIRAVTPDRSLDDGTTIPSPAGDLHVVHTPGHTPGHVCLDLPDGGVVFTGDHVLARISPNVGWHPQSDPDPLGDYLDSLDRVIALDAPRALPGHLHGFDDPAGRARELASHHAAELDRVADVLATGARTVWEVAGALEWSRSWDELEPFHRRAAVAEVGAHLVRLERTGRAARRGGHVATWLPTD